MAETEAQYLCRTRVRWWLYCAAFRLLWRWPLRWLWPSVGRMIWG